MIRNNLLLIACLFGIGFYVGCKPGPGPGTNSASTTLVGNDTIQRKQIDSLVTMNTRSLDTVYRKRIPYHVHSGTDSIDYWFAEDQMGRIAMNLHPDSNQIWPYFWIYKGDLIRVRVRKYVTDEVPPFSQETMIYLQNGEPVYCEERRKDLSAGEIPGLVMREKYAPCTRDFSEIEQDWKPYWKIALQELKKSNLLPSWVKE